MSISSKAIQRFIVTPIMTFFQIQKKKDTKFDMERRETTNSLMNIKQQKQNWKNKASQQSSYNQNILVLTQKSTNPAIEQTAKSRT